MCFGPATRLTSRVKQPEIAHTMCVGKSPNEQVLKRRLREML